MSILECGRDLRIHYRIDGERGPLLLLFNGAGLPLTFWGSLATRLAQYCRVLRFDQRNAGRTEFEGNFSLLDTAADAARLLDHLQCDDALLVGHAWGGRAAQVFARDYPHRTRAMVLCGTGGKFAPIGTGDGLKRLSDARRAQDRAAWERALEAQFCAPGFSNRRRHVFEELADAAWQKPLARGRWQADIAPTESFWGLSQARSLLLYGKHDKNGTPENAMDLQRRLGARLVMYEDAGHFVIREKEDEVLAQILAFAT